MGAIQALLSVYKDKRSRCVEFVTEATARVADVAVNTGWNQQQLVTLLKQVGVELTYLLGVVKQECVLNFNSYFELLLHGLIYQIKGEANIFCS